MTHSQSKGSKQLILIVKPSSLGDILHTMPAVELLKAAWPDAEFHWLAASAFIDVVKYCPSVTNIIEFPRSKLGSAKEFIPAFFKLRRQLRQFHYQMVIDFQGLLRSAFIARMAPADTHVGFESPREPLAGIFYNRKISIPDNCVHAVDKNLQLAENLCHSRASHYRLPSLPEFAVAAERLLETVHSGEMLIAVALGARWQSKRWPDRFFVNLLNRVLNALPGCRIVLLGAADSQDSARTIMNALNNPRLLSLVGKTSLPELIEIIHRCDMLICNDSGPMHIAAATGKPVFAFFGPTRPEKTGPYGDKHHIFQRNIDCIGCLKRYCPNGDLKCHELDIDKITEEIIQWSETIETS